MVTRRRSSLPPFQTKKGRYGTLYRFKIMYRDTSDYASPDFVSHKWAYDADHAEDMFLDSDDTGWSIVSIDRMRESRGN